MARGRFAAVLAVPLLVSPLLWSGVAAHATESEERALREQLADKDEYRAKLILELQRRETLLAKQQDYLAQQEDKLKALYAKLSAPVSEDEEDAGPAPGGLGPTAADGRKLKPDAAPARRAKDFETQTYKTNVARYAVGETQREITYLKSLLARAP